MAVKEKLSKLEKSPTGIRGMDEITNGGLPKGRPTLVCGNAGCGKTVLGMQFLVNGALESNEPGVFMSFEETEDDLAKNFASFGFDLTNLVRRKLLAIDYVYVERSEIEETGEYSLDGLFIRLGLAIDTLGAKRVVLDSIEALFSGLQNTAILRAELRRLFRWLKGKGVTAVVTAERGENSLTRYGLEEYIADCVILLDFRVEEQISTRRLRIVKYRGSVHGNDEYPFLISADGFTLQPITSVGLEYPVSNERISSGVPRLDAMLGGSGFFRGTTILISGTAGTGKSSLCGYFARATCQHGERCLYLAFEEAGAQVVRNMRSIGLDLQPLVDQGCLRFMASRPMQSNLEKHLIGITETILDFKPSVVIIDPISNLIMAGSMPQTKAMLIRLIDFLKMKGITCLLTDLTHQKGGPENTSEQISSLIDTWILVRDIEINGERNRGLYILKSRGMAHSNQIREFLMSDQGIDLIDAYLGPSGVLTGSARAAQEAEARNAALAHQQDLARRQRELSRKRQALEVQLTTLHAELDSLNEEIQTTQSDEAERAEHTTEDRTEMARLRRASD